VQIRRATYVEEPGARPLVDVGPRSNLGRGGRVGKHTRLPPGDSMAGSHSRPRRSCLARLMVLCAVAAAPAAASADYPRVDAMGAHISKARVSNGRVRVSATFHRTHLFFAQVYANPKSSSRIRWIRSIALGEHHVGLAHVSFLLGSLKPGNYGIVILRTRTAYPWLSVSTGGPQTTTWLGLTVKQTGQVVALTLH
jgi:hypothetical protein